MGKSRFEDFLQFAIEQEREAAALYHRQSELVESRTARELLKEMAAMEKEHERILLSVAQDGESEFSRLDDMTDMRLADFIVDAKLTAQSSIEDVFLFSIKAEQKAVNLYSRLAELELEPKTRQLFERLVKEEQKHKLDLESEFERGFMWEN
jgi:rubrerythrin